MKRGPVERLLKVQRPTNDPHAPWLVYDRMRSINFMMPVNEVSSTVVTAMGRDHKAHFAAVRQDDGRIIWGRRMPDPGW